MIAINF